MNCPHAKIVSIDNQKFDSKLRKMNGMHIVATIECLNEEYKHGI